MTRLWGAAGAAALLLLPCFQAATALPIGLDVVGSQVTPCGSGSLCVDVAAQLHGSTGFASYTFGLSLPAPDPTQWTPVGATIDFSGAIAIAGSYDTSLVRSRQTGSDRVLMGIYGEQLSFSDAAGLVLHEPSVVQTNTCAPVAVDYALPTVTCSDGNNGIGHREFGAGELSWTQTPLTLRVDFASGDPQPIAGSERFDLQDQQVFVSVIYDPIPEPSGRDCLLLGTTALAAIASARRKRPISSRHA
ncbi:MAG TPA: hypothetical protein VMW35_07760 [Myxococcota bacterium]|jgi:hypothetical protein|nr:hypothetical protein [Myxococcota bacterium]